MNFSELLWYLIPFFYGIILGSFLSVCIYRIPKKISLAIPPSSCPACKEPLHWWENIPLASYLLLAGRCRSCGSRISLRYPFVEFLTGCLVAYLWAVNPIELSSAKLFALQTGSFLCELAFLSLLIVITFIDWDYQLIFDETIGPGIAVGLCYSLLAHQPASAVIAAAGAALFFYAIRVLGGFVLLREAMGLGDVKLAAMIGSFLGWKLTILALFLSFPIGLLMATALLALNVKQRKEPIPFGPAMAMGAFLAFFWGNQIWYGYLHFLRR